MLPSVTHMVSQYIVWHMVQRYSIIYAERQFLVRSMARNVSCLRY
jgi:hypothetical protein